jgi:hypothetical protein
VGFGKNATFTEKIITHRGGDALASVIAALAAFKAVVHEDALIPDHGGDWEMEGCVYGSI